MLSLQTIIGILTWLTGSFGSYPLPVRNALRGYQKLSEAAPDKFLRYQYVDLLDKARDRISQLVNAPLDECVFVNNATAGKSMHRYGIRLLYLRGQA